MLYEWPLIRLRVVVVVVLVVASAQYDPVARGGNRHHTNELLKRYFIQLLDVGIRFSLCRSGLAAQRLAAMPAWIRFGGPEWVSDEEFHHD